MRLTRMESNFLSGLARFRRWQLKFEADIQKDQVQRELRNYMLSMTPIQMAMLATIDPAGFEELMKVVKGENRNG